MKFVMATAAAGDKAIAGPVFAAAMIYRVNEAKPALLGRKKPLGPDDQQRLLEQCRAVCLGWAVTVQFVNQINRLGYAAARTKALSFAAYRAVERASRHGELFKGTTPSEWTLQTDNHEPLHREVVGPSLQRLYQDLGHGAPWQLRVAALLAALRRQEYLADLAREYPEYELEKNYGTVTNGHREGLERYGPAKIHWNASGVVKHYRARSFFP